MPSESEFPHHRELGHADTSSDTYRCALTLGLMAKYWDVGRVKTRLGATIGMRKAALLHRMFVQHLCQTMSAVAETRVISLSPDDRIDAMNESLRHWGLAGQWRISAQGEGDLGSRMERWFRDQIESDPSQAILIGADCPTLRPEQISQAADVLADHDVVLGPAADGGYYLIGLRGPWNDQYETLFREIPWSSPQVLGVTLDRVSSASLSAGQLETREDIDTMNELNSLRERLRQLPASALEKEIDAILDDDAASRELEQ